MCAAPKGNQFWRLRSEHGREKLFAEPDLLWAAAEEYFNWCDGHPWYKVEASKSPGVKKDNQLIKVPTAIPYTLSGFCLYCGASENWWKEFRKNEGLSKDFLALISRIEEIIRTQKFTGAAVGAFNANIISRDLGLADRQEARQVDKDGNDVPMGTVSVVLPPGMNIEFPSNLTDETTDG